MLKNKHMVLSILLLILALFSTIALAENNPIILDEADLLSEVEEAKLLQAMLPVCDYGIPIFWTTTEEGDYMNLAQKCFWDHVSREESAIIFVINMNAGQLTIFSTGTIYKVITEKIAQEITDNVSRIATSGNYYSCATSVFDQIAGNLESNDISTSIFPARIKAMRWEHVVQIESKQRVKKSGWSLPEEAKLIDEHEELHHYDQQLDHIETHEVQRSRPKIDHYETYYTFTDNGDGSFAEVEHQRPVYTTEYYTETVEIPVYVSIPCYQTKYYYEIDIWIPTRKEIKQGTDIVLAWPKLELAENERLGSKAAFYYVILSINNQVKTYLVDEYEWLSMRVGKSVYINKSDLSITDEMGNKLIQLTEQEEKNGLSDEKTSFKVTFPN